MDTILEDSIVLANTLRLIVIFLCTYSCYLCVITCFWYYQRTKMEIRVFIPYTNLGLHIYTAAISTILISIYCLVVTYSRLSQPISWHSPYLVIAFSLLAFSQYKIHVAQSNQYRMRKEQIAKAHAGILTEEITGVPVKFEDLTIPYEGEEVSGAPDKFKEK